ncbi:S9 family peptidase [Fluviispira multicolorata]|uniref:Prolyl oligopeptidase family serine peptidase n=1 Tax=Fluviispira multicolorata TaxID=2654512 RepID=A0A833JBD6_9BACT|nr:prolyl oligopeptidase family serine peptidase [Fluviispira multicolorata]KAB8028509.1 prolyl oligopeptidase family serine peptidase [Fluviispira multicolorata]
MSASKQSENFGKWKSPITAEMIASKSISFNDIHMDQGILYWCESRPEDKGRNVIVSSDENQKYTDETSSEFNVGTSVHGYGGGAFYIKKQMLYFADMKTGLVYQKNISNQKIKAIVEPGEYRYADFCSDPEHKFLYCIRKDDTGKNQFPTTEIVRIFIENKKVEVLLTGADFYSNVTISPNGKKISWLQWDHPNMPWDATELWLADISEDGSLINNKNLSEEKKQSYYQPTWSHDSQLFVSSDKTGYWNIYQYSDKKFINLYERNVDFGRPMWITGTRCFEFLSANEIICCYSENGIWKTGTLRLDNKVFTEHNNSLTCIYNIVAENNRVAFIGGNPTLAPAIIISNKNNLNSIEILRNSIDKSIENEFISLPELIKFQTRDLKKAYAFYYPPKNPLYCPKENELPPLIVKVHGGPTANADYMLTPKIQYYTSRGYAYVEVNYRGSTGYGREYRDQLKGKWGIIDVEDCIDCALYLCELKKADKDKLIISGSSSGGFTVLSSLAFHNVYKCGSCTYGIADLIAMTEHIHKFEAYYDQGLLGGSVQDTREIYFNRSPINSAHKIKSPVIFFHGDKDPVVHVSQTYKIADALNKNNIYNETFIFKEEGHGFRNAENIVISLTKELDFYSKVL